MKVIQILLGCIGRIFISLIFILSAIGQILSWQPTLSYMTTGLQAWSSHLMLGEYSLRPLLDFGLEHASILLGIAIIFSLLGGLLVFFGIKTRFGAFLLLLFLIPVTLVMHAFWNLSGPDRELQMIMFMKNLSMLGAVLYLLAFGNGTSRSKSAPAKAKAAEK